MSESDDPIHQRLDQLLRDYAGRVAGLLRSYGLDRQGIDPADVEQEVRIRLWRALQRDRSGAFHASYVQRVVASTVIDAIRRAGVRAADPLPESDDDAAQLPERGVSPESSVADRQRMECVARCLDGIPERRRLPITLHLQGFSLQEIADLSGVPSSEAARKLVSRGLAELKTRLREFGYGDFDE
ncbi:MAG: sigma-70 family RNA polymerase sigma factor [Rhodanobacteraceae bacterium]